jgi:hypothetical protein
MELTPRERSALRAAAHPLRPVVLIGDNGLTEAVLKEIDMNLSAHDLGTFDRSFVQAQVHSMKLATLSQNPITQYVSFNEYEASVAQ